MIKERSRKEDDSYGVVDNVLPGTAAKRDATCRYCNFKFKANFTEKTPKNCPYCGKTFFFDD